MSPSNWKCSGCRISHHFSYIVTVSFIGGRNWWTRENHRPVAIHWHSLSNTVVPLYCGKQIVNHSKQRVWVVPRSLHHICRFRKLVGPLQLLQRTKLFVSTKHVGVNALRSSEGLSHLHEYPTTGYKGPGYTGNIINGVISLGKVWRNQSGSQSP
jgi:hypothetical protein